MAAKIARTCGKHNAKNKKNGCHCQYAFQTIHQTMLRFSEGYFWSQSTKAPLVEITSRIAIQPPSHITITAGISSTKEHKDNAVAAKEGRPSVLG